MEIAVRSYLAAGVAVVGATSIALAPVQVLPPDFEIRGDRTVAVFEDVSLSTLGTLIAAAQSAPGPIGEAVDSASLAARAAIIGLSGALENALVAVVEGDSAFQAVVDSLLDRGSVLATAIDNAIANFPTPQVFVSALVDAFATIDVNLAFAIGDALAVALELGVELDAGAIGEALANAGEELAAIFDAALDRLPSPGDFATAFEAGLQDVISGLTTVADATETAIAKFSTALTAAIDAGLAAGQTAFEAVIAGLQNARGQLAEAFSAALAAFPTPEAFVEALVSAFSAIDVDLGAALEIALEIALNAALDSALGPLAGFVYVDVDVDVIADALLEAGAGLADAFNAAFEDFPTPAQFVAAIGEGIVAFAANVNAIADATAEAIGTVSAALTAAIRSGIDITSTAFSDFLEALVEGGGTLATAVKAALDNLPSPALFVSALIDASVSLGPVLAELGASLQARLDAGLDLGAAALAGFAEVGADISAAIGASLEGLPTPIEFVESFAEAGEQFGAAADELTQIGVDAANNFAAAADAVVEAFRATAESALENGNDALQAIGAGIYAATQALAEAASDVNIGGAISAAIRGSIGGGLGGFDGLRGQAVGDVTDGDENPPTVTSDKVDPSPATETGSMSNPTISLNANSSAEGQATRQRQLPKGPAQLREALDTAGKQVNDGLTETRENLKGAAEQTRENLKGAAEQTREDLKGAAEQTRKNLKGAAKGTRENLKGAANGTRENLKGAADQTRKNLDGVRKNVKSAVGGDKKSADKDAAKNTSRSDPESE